MKREEPISVLWMVSPKAPFLRNLFPRNIFQYHFAPSFETACRFLKQKPIKVIVSHEVSYFNSLKKLFPEPIRILLVREVDIETTQSAINQGEVFRFVALGAPVKEIQEAVIEGARHFDLIKQNQKLLFDLKSQNEKLKQMVEKLESQVGKKTQHLGQIEEKLKKAKRNLEQLNALIAWINASSSLSELSSRVETALKGILSVEKILLLETTTEEIVGEVKKRGMPSLVMPLIYQKKCLGHLYFLCREEKDIMALYERADLLKQAADTVALTMEKIKIFNLSVERRQAWQKTFDAIRDPVALVNKDYHIIRANLTYSHVSGMKIQELIGEKCYKVFQKREDPCEGCLLQESLKQKKPQNFELKSAAQDTLYMTSSFPTENLQKLSVLYYRDQGEERRLRAQLIHTEKMAEIGILAGSVAHEINNPLGGILAYSQILLSEVPKDSELHQDLKEIEAAAVRSKNIVENLLYFSRASKEEDRKSLDIEAVLDKAISLVSLKTRYRDLVIEKHYAHVPEIFGDFNQLVQVFLNILQNSAEAILEKKAKKETGKIDIFIKPEEMTRKVLIKIQDNGSGIAESHAAKIFNPFFTTKDKKEHPGLGLSVSYQIIKSHGGEIKVENTSSGGSLFKVILPLS